jgi:hypothetical protein
MITICYEYCKKYCLQFSAKKTKIVVFGKASKVENLASLYLDSTPIDYVKEWKYLGVTIVSGKRLSFSATADLRKFYRASNSIFGALSKPSEVVSMQLLYSNCVPILTYASAIKEFCHVDMLQCNSALNNAIRKIFSYNRWESIRHLRQGLGYPAIEEIFARAKRNFSRSLATSSNAILSHLSHHFNVE